jgi:hypothetical protein
VTPQQPFSALSVHPRELLGVLSTIRTFRRSESVGNDDLRTTLPVATYLDSLNQKRIVAALEQAVNEQGRSDEWPVYLDYELVEVKGHKYVYARDTLAQIQGRERYRPLSSTWAGLFLKFAKLADNEGLDKHPLDSEKNERVALAWAYDYGVLGLTYGHLSKMRYPGPDTTAGFLGLVSARGSAATEHLNEARGGYPNESVARFAFEAWEAHVALRLFEAAAPDREDGPNLETIFDLLPEWAGYIPRTPEGLRNWALFTVKDSAQNKIAGRCYPRLYQGPDGYVQGWGFNSLLGAMWLQMMWVLTGSNEIRRCLWCGDVIALEPGEQPTDLKRNSRGKYKTRSDKKFCYSKDGVEGSCKGLYHYHNRVKPTKYRL